MDVARAMSDDLEALAEVLWLNQPRDTPKASAVAPWVDVHPYTKKRWRKQARAVLASDWLAAHVAAARAEAWDEGYLRGVLDQESELERADNPYRETTPATMSPEQARRILARSKPTEIRMPAGPSIPPGPTP